MSVQTAVVMTTVCWAPGCTWHATGTNEPGIDLLAARHATIEQHRVDVHRLPLTGEVDGLVAFHECTAYDQDRPDTPGRACVTDARLP